MFTKRILHECSCFIELIKRVEEKIKKNARLSKHFISFCNEFNKFNDTGVRMLDSIYHNYDIKLILKSYVWRENVRVLSYA